MGAGSTRISLTVVLPAALPGIFAGLRVALPISLIVVMLTEMLGDSRGLGYYIAISGASFRPDRVFAGIVVAGACGFLLDKLLLLVGKQLMPSERLRRGL